MSTISGTNGADTLTGTSSNDVINSGNGDDIVDGGAGNDILNGGAGSDILDGGSGSDQLSGGSGDDTMIYNISENSTAGTKDVYTGGSGTDTVLIEFTREQWLDPANQTQIANYLAHIAGVTNTKTGEVSNGSASDFVFTFGSSTLTVQMTEVLKVTVDGVALNPADEAVTAVADSGTTTEDGQNTNIYVLQNDKVPDLVKALAVDSAPAHGTATLVQPDPNNPSGWYFKYEPNTADFQHLAAGQTATDTFTYIVTDADGDTSTATVTITITGTNDVAVIGGVSTATVQEDSTTPNLTASGTLTIADVDTGESSAVAQTGTAGSNGYGVFTVDAAGHWTYTADNSQAAIQQLGATQSLTDSFTVVSADGTASQVVTVTIQGTNDVPVIGGVSTAAVAEDAATPNLTANGILTIDDVDANQSSFVEQTGTTGSNGYGVFTVDAAGHWTYTADNSQTAIQQLGATQSLTDSFTVVSADGTGSQVVTVTINGTNDVPVIGGVSTATVQEDSTTPNLTVNGTLTIADVDMGESNFVAQAGTAGSSGYGTFSVDTAGHWTYTADDSQAAIQQLGATQSLTDSFTVVSADGTAKQTVTVTIQGTNDVPVIGGVSTAAISEDDTTPNLTASGTLTIADVDTGESSAVAQTGTAGSNGYGVFTVDAAGHWTYTADNSQAAIQQLGATQSLTDSFTVVSADGTASQVVTVTIQGTNDVPVIGGVNTATVSEDGATPDLTANGTLTIDDVDSGESSFVAQTATAGSNGYGTFTVDATGHWTYTADNSQEAIQQLGAKQSLTDSFTVVSADGTASQVVTVTINGTNDAAIISGDVTGSVVEASGNGAGTPTASGTLTDTDVDNTPNTFNAVAAGTASALGYGTYQMTEAGIWTYTLNNTNTDVQALNAGDHLTDTFTVSTIDGTQQTVTVTIDGSNDAALVSGTAAGTVAEAGSVNNGGTPTVTGDLLATDVDNTADAFQAVSTATYSANKYGTYTMTAAGVWTYTLDNSNATVNALNDGGTLNDSFTVYSEDGTAKVVSITINGANDISGAAATDLSFTAAVATGNSIPGTIGTFSYTDLDGGAGQHTYSLEGSSIFNLDKSTGVLTTTSGLADQTTYTLKVTVSQDGASSYTEDLSIITGTNQGDSLNGGSGDDVIYAGGSSDIILAGSGNDTVFGQQANDGIHGGIGNDVLYGGGANDTFYFDTALNASTNVDQVMDFEAGGNGDKPADSLYLSTSVFTQAHATGGVLNANDFLAVSDIANVANTSTAHIIYDSGTGSLYYDANGGSASDAVKFATLTIASGTFDSSDIKVGA